MQRPAIVRGVVGLSAQFQTDEQQASAAKWLPPPLDKFATGQASGDGEELTSSDDSDESSEDTEDDAANFSGSAKSGSAGDTRDPSPSAQVVVGAGALRGEQEAYTMRDVQSMKVPRLRSMCEARGLKKNGTKQQLITRLLASTADSLDAIPGWSDRKTTPTPTRLNPQLSGISTTVNGVTTGAHGRLTVDGDSSESGFEAELDMGGSFESGQQAVWSGDAVAMETPGFGRNRNTLSTEMPRDEDTYRPTGEALEGILNAPKLRRRAGVTYYFPDSKITKYERDRNDRMGSRISALPAPRDTTGVEIDMMKNFKKNNGGKAPANPMAMTLNGIPREFLPPSLRAYDPNASRKRRGPGRPRQSDGDEDGVMANEWAMVKSGGGMSDTVTESPFDAMIRIDIEEEERLNPKKKRKKKVVAVVKEEYEEDFAALMGRLDDEDDDVRVELARRSNLKRQEKEEEEEEEEVVDTRLSRQARQDDELPDMDEEEEFVKTREVASIKGFVPETDDDDDDDDDDVARQKMKAVLGDDLEPDDQDDEDQSTNSRSEDANDNKDDDAKPARAKKARKANKSS